MLSSIQDIENYLQTLIPNSSQLRFPGEEGIARTKEFLRLLGSPQNTLRVIHVAGTSGKGSTSFIISNLLKAHGFKVGLSLSPHLLDVRERMEINNELISPQKFITYFGEIMPFIEKMNRSRYGKITYFEALVGMTYYSFFKEKVDYAVIETGLGGEFDGTNTVERQDKLSVITKIGFDHMNILGTTLAEIAHQKAMICTKRGDLLTIYQSPSAYNEIKKVVHQKKACLYVVEKKNIKRRLSFRAKGEKSRSDLRFVRFLSRVDLLRNDMELKFTFSFAWNSLAVKNLTLGLLGDHQVQNASLALATVYHLSKRDRFPIKMDTISSILKTLRFKGRFDIIYKKNSRIILDGAHNVQKMKALLKTIKKLYPHKKYTFILAFKKGKEYKKMIQLIIPYAEKMIITHIFSSSQDLQHFSVPPDSIKKEIAQLGFSNVEVKKNIDDIIKIMRQQNTSYVVSGSLYLLGDIYKALEV